MRYALINGERTEPQPKLAGHCPACGAQIIAKCGQHVLWHWAHKSRRHCDQWWEAETEWHRNWKALFPPGWQEVVHVDEVSQEKHIADVKNPSGLVLEFQHSPISPAELSSREAFYGTLIWVVDGCRNELDKSFFSLSLSKPTIETPHEFPLRWWGPSKLLATWSSARRDVYLDFGEDILWKLLRFDRETRQGAVFPYGKERLVRQWIEA